MPEISTLNDFTLIENKYDEILNILNSQKDTISLNLYKKMLNDTTLNKTLYFADLFCKTFEFTNNKSSSIINLFEKLTYNGEYKNKVTKRIEFLNYINEVYVYINSNKFDLNRAKLYTKNYGSEWFKTKYNLTSADEEWYYNNVINNWLKKWSDKKL